MDEDKIVYCNQCYHEFEEFDFLDRKVLGCPACKRADWYTHYYTVANFTQTARG